MTMTLSGNGTITGLVAGGLPDATITQPDLAAGVAGNGPAFSAYMSGSQTISNGVWTKVSVGVEQYDTNSCFDTSTYRFTPNVAGYYLITANIDGGASSGSWSRTLTALYKNGSATYGLGPNIVSSAPYNSPLSVMVYLNGTTDYVELYALILASTAIITGDESTYFQGVLVRAA